MKLEQYLEQAEQYREDMKARRRDFHKYPESGWREFRTTAKIIEILREHQIPFRYGYEIINKDYVWSYPSEAELSAAAAQAVEQGADPEIIRTMNGITGACAIIETGKPGPVVALRVDIDCNDVREDDSDSHLPAAEGFCSINSGCTHACGHDGHATLGIFTCLLLNAMKEDLSGTIRVIFQPAEEGVRGAKSIVENGHLDGVDYLIGSHVSDKAADDPAVVIPGSHGSLATTKYDVFFHGVSAHAGGSPEKGKNVMPAVATAILNLYGIPRNSAGMSRINVGTVVAGSGRNVIADVAKMEIEVRGETTEINQYMEEYAKNIIEGAAKMHGCTSEMKVMGSAYSLTSDQALMDRVRRVCEENLHLPVSETTSSRNGGSEDVSYMMRRVQEQGGQATFMRILTKEAAPGHNRRFDFDEQALPNAVKIFCGTVYDILG